MDRLRRCIPTPQAKTPRWTSRCSACTPPWRPSSWRCPWPAPPRARARTARRARRRRRAVRPQRSTRWARRAQEARRPGMRDQIRWTRSERTLRRVAAPHRTSRRVTCPRPLAHRQPTLRVPEASGSAAGNLTASWTRWATLTRFCHRCRVIRRRRREACSPASSVAVDPSLDRPTVGEQRSPFSERPRRRRGQRFSHNNSGICLHWSRPGCRRAWVLEARA
mmetsp:Transcript_84042/g.213928  ORF Transcript_84042/g.213928 Transcript_84042/m.213928 type:complete len:222 (+) Transcript_84042:589-1254(+)